MVKRKIIKIDQDKCNGCGLCIPNCPEGALKIIDGKARLISDLFCDGLGACIGHCPQGAITIEEREAEPYDEKKVMENIVKQGKNVIKAHLEHLKEHNQTEYLKEAIEFLKEKKIDISLEEEVEMKHQIHSLSGCPGSKIMDFRKKEKEKVSDTTGKRPSELRQWPIQLHLVSPVAPYYQKADVLLSADCVAYTVGDFHKDFLKGKSLAIACPKLDEGQDEYVEKIKSLIDEAKINTLTVMTMQVPCCYGLVAIAQEAAKKAKRKIPIKSIVVSLEGEILS
ncbi:MAG: 4Fe-4S binding protein [Candidatus Omnitrophica bacterium]|nr:4Fe-4S binding protein [Candidatus Omnitrophota bacterium]MCM8800334.1 4Fe-4S binding protein [Candidatus Omnitrophota bacterium]